MDAATHPIDMQHWTPNAHAEPSVRVGVILEADGRASVEFVLPDKPYTLTADNGKTQPVMPGAEVCIQVSGDGLIASWSGGTFGPSERLRIEPDDRVPAAPGAGVRVLDVVAGRGFHWQKCADQTLAGSLEFHAAPGGVVMVNELPLEDYLAGVITAEMSSACPVEFLKAQCVVARSWLLAMAEPKHQAEPFDRCNDDCCQRYQGTGDMSQPAVDAVGGSRGLVLLDPAAQVLDANYSKSCGGISELPEAVWGEPKPGLREVIDAPPGDPVGRFMPVTEDNLDAFLEGDWLTETKAYCSTHVVPVEAIGKYLGRVDEVDDYFRWSVAYTREKLETLLRDKLPEAAGLEELRDVRVTRRGVSGRAIEVELTWLDRSGQPVAHLLDSEYRIREVLHRGFLYSSAFAVRLQRGSAGEIESVTLRGAGWGHGAGLCQIGALGMALCGHDAAEICLHYYPDAHLETAYP